MKLRRKNGPERSNTAANGRDFTRYHIVVNGKESEPLRKRQTILAMVKELGRLAFPTRRSLASKEQRAAQRSGVIRRP